MNNEKEPYSEEAESAPVSPAMNSSVESLGSRISSPVDVSKDQSTLKEAKAPEGDDKTLNIEEESSAENYFLLERFKALLRQFIGAEGYTNYSVFALEANPKANENRRGPQSQSSVYRGVTKHMRTQKWEAHIWQRKQLYLGGFSNATDAAKAHDIMSLKLKDEAAVTNFTRESYKELLPFINRLSWSSIMASLRQCTKGIHGDRKLFSQEIKQPSTAESLLPNSTPTATASPLFTKYNRRLPANLSDSEYTLRPLHPQTLFPSSFYSHVDYLRTFPQSYRNYPHDYTPSMPMNPQLFNLYPSEEKNFINQYSLSPPQFQVPDCPLFATYHNNQSLRAEPVPSYLDANSVPRGADIHVLQGRVIENNLYPELRAESATQAYIPPIRAPQPAEIARGKLDVKSSGSSSDVEFKAALRSAGVNDYEEIFSSIDQNFDDYDQPFSRFW